MPHDLSQDADGNYEMMYVGEMPWHGFGTRLLEPPATAAEAINAAHLAWKVEKKQLYVGEKRRPLEGQFAVVRLDRWERNEDGAVFAQVSDTYQPLQNEEAFTFFDPVIASGKAFYETAGALGKGERIWLMIRLRNDVEIVAGDRVARFLLLSNTHDGSGAIQVKFTPVRVVCQNTLSQALNFGESVRVAHRTSLHARLDNLSQSVERMLRHFDKVEADFKRLADVKMTPNGVVAYVSKVFPEPEPNTDPKKYERAKKQIVRDRKEAASLYQSGTGNDLPAVQGTLWAAYNGIAEYADFRRTAARDKRWLESMWFGNAFDIKVRAFEAAMQIAEGNGRLARHE